MISANGRIYFTDKELSCNCCGLQKYVPSFLNDLLALRLAYGKPMPLTCGCRCPSHNKEVGGVSNSYHLTDGNINSIGGASAVDVVLPSNSENLHNFIQCAMMMKWSVLIYPKRNFMHIDKRTHPIFKIME